MGVKKVLDGKASEPIKLRIRFFKKEGTIATALLEEHHLQTCEDIGFAPVGLDEPYRIVVGNNPVNRIDPSGLWYIDVNVTGGSGKGGTAGLQIGPSGVYVYGGLGYGSGGGVSVTWNTGDPSPGLSVNATVSGGTGIVGGSVSGSYSSEGISGSVGGGWGVGLGYAVTGTYTYPIWQSDKPNTCK